MASINQVKAPLYCKRTESEIVGNAPILFAETCYNFQVGMGGAIICYIDRSVLSLF